MDLKQKVGPVTLETWLYVLIAVVVLVIGFYSFYFFGWSEVLPPWMS